MGLSIILYEIKGYCIMAVNYRKSMNFPIMRPIPHKMLKRMEAMAVKLIALSSLNTSSLRTRMDTTLAAGMAESRAKRDVTGILP